MLLPGATDTNMITGMIWKKENIMKENVFCQNKQFSIEI